VPPARVAERTVVEVWLEPLDERWGEDFGWTGGRSSRDTAGRRLVFVEHVELS